MSVAEVSSSILLTVDGRIEGAGGESMDEEVCASIL